MKIRALQLSLAGLVLSSLVFALATSGTGQEPSKSTTTPDKPKKVVKTDAEWRKLLPRESYMVTRHAYTEPAFSGKLVNNHAKGVYECICCGTELFSSKTKFESGTGWPSFYAPYQKQNVDLHPDADGSGRMEVTCSVCDAHLGHVFDDGPAPTGLRFCMNSVSLKFVKDTPPAKKTTEKAETTEKADKKETPAKDTPTTETPKTETPK